MGEDQGFSPAEVSALLGVSTSTLRTYSVRFDPLLSPAARGGMRDDRSGYAHRRYGAEDVDLLRRAKELLDAGLSYDATLRQLASGSVLARPIVVGARQTPGPRSKVRASPPVEPDASRGRSGRRASSRASAEASPPEPSASRGESRSAGGPLGPRFPIENAPAPPTQPPAGDRVLAAPALAERTTLNEELTRLVEAAVAPLRADIEMLTERVRTAEERARASERAAEEARAQLARFERRLDAFADQVSESAAPSPPAERGWLSHLLRRG